jgi:hypothetical protein
MLLEHLVHTQELGVVWGGVDFVLTLSLVVDAVAEAVDVLQLHIVRQFG